MPAISILSSMFRTSSPARSNADGSHRMEVPPSDPLVSDVALAIYLGGKIDGPSGLQVVAHVIQNRIKHATFASDAQSVVLSGTDQFMQAGQFGPTFQSNMEKQLFEQALKLATEMIHAPGHLLTPDPTGGALYYDKRGPAWLHSVSRPSGRDGQHSSFQQLILSKRAAASRAAAAGAAARSPSDRESPSPPPSTLQPERPRSPIDAIAARRNRSRQPFSFLRNRSLSWMFSRRAENSTTASSSSEQHGSSSSSEASSAPSHARRERSVPSRHLPPAANRGSAILAGQHAAAAWDLPSRDLPRGGIMAAREAVGSLSTPPALPSSSSQSSQNPQNPIWFPLPSPGPQPATASRPLFRPVGLTGRTPSSLRAGLSGTGRLELDSYQDMILPCGLFQDEVIELMCRDLNPEDFDILSKLDERLPKRDTLQRNLIDVLPRVHAKDCGITECRVCLSEVEGSTLLVKLPCQHAFHPACISKWLTQCKNTCPLCSVPIAYPAGFAREGPVARKSDVASASGSYERSAPRQGLGPPRQDEPRLRPPLAQAAVPVLHL